MNTIKSKDNKAVKAARKLLQKKHRKDSYLIEGFHLYEEAKKSKAQIEDVFVLENYQEEYPEASPVSEEVLRSMTDSKTPQGLVAVVKKDSSLLADCSKLKQVLVLDGVQDPGNVGTLIRTADAAAYDAVFLSKACADLYSPKVLRSMQGSNFHLPIFSMELELIYDFLKNQGLNILVTSLEKNSVSYKEVDFDHNFALVLGNEGQGVSALSKDCADQIVHIDMPGLAESLNVAVAGGILIFASLKSE
ncbi:RNA methyltransferase [Streptococcaceae bacterium ESL0729]|nr:RNA methyltransferase [Streptococcaceae bacterium ESL0729]